MSVYLRLIFTSDKVVTVLTEAYNVSHKRSHKLEGIGVRRIRTLIFHYLFHSDSINTSVAYYPMKTGLLESEAEVEERTNQNWTLWLVYSSIPASDSVGLIFTRSYHSTFLIPLTTTLSLCQWKLAPRLHLMLTLNNFIILSHFFIQSCQSQPAQFKIISIMSTPNLCISRHAWNSSYLTLNTTNWYYWGWGWEKAESCSRVLIDLLIKPKGQVRNFTNSIPCHEKMKKKRVAHSPYSASNLSTCQHTEQKNQSV